MNTRKCLHIVITCLHVFSSVLWCPMRIPFFFFCKGWVLYYIFYVYWSATQFPYQVMFMSFNSNTAGVVLCRSLFFLLSFFLWSNCGFQLPFSCLKTFLVLFLFGSMFRNTAFWLPLCIFKLVLSCLVQTHAFAYKHS